ncbi:hypothetical protein [Halomicrococcus gelatinilyticus]|uniref:hypothetical protein n=1 Tax=Halomicrococcus gelatinilyticus TaxID=1702103 RepID=UPI002E1078BE
MKIGQYLTNKLGILPTDGTKKVNQVSATKAAEIGQSELNWCSKEMNYLSTDIASGEKRIVEKRVERVRKQLEYVEQLLESIEEEEI